MEGDILARPAIMVMFVSYMTEEHHREIRYVLPGHLSGLYHLSSNFQLSHKDLRTCPNELVLQTYPGEV